MFFPETSCGGTPPESGAGDGVATGLSYDQSIHTKENEE
jgi:hypothetical protein